MAASSRPFQSQTVTRWLAGYRQFAQGAERWLRQGRTALLWGVQVALYPAYVGFQSLRSLSRRLQATQPWQKVIAWLTGQSPQALPSSVDTPIRALLSIIQPQAVRRPGRLRFVDQHGQFLRQSRAENVLTNGQWHRLPLQEPVRGVASNLNTRQLVLVTADNSIFDQLTADQQARLHRAIVLLLAEYAAMGWRQRRQQQLQSPSLPLPAAESTQWWPVQWLHQLMRWMQTGPLAMTTNLFGEARVKPTVQTVFRNLPTPLPPATGGVGQSHWADNCWILTQKRQGTIQSPLQTVAHSVPALSKSQATVVEVGNSKITVQAGSSVTAKANASKGIDELQEWQSLPVATGPSPQALPSDNTIEAQVTLVNYVDHPLVLVLRWLDACIYAAENWLRRVWQWWLSHL
jgi:hypothetical protein